MLINKLLRRLSFGLLLLVLASCDKPLSEAINDAAERVARDENTIVVVTLNSPNTYYVNSDKEFAGLEYDLATAFLKYINENKSNPQESDKKIKFVIAESIEHAISKILNKRADIAAADLTVTEARKGIIDYSSPYQDVQQQVVYNKNFTKNPARAVSNLVGQQIVVPAASSFVERLKENKNEEPELEWMEREAVDSEKLIEQVANGSIQYTIADSHLVSTLQVFYPNLRVAFSLGNPEKIAWGFLKANHPELRASANEFFTKIKTDGTLRNLIDRYHGNSNRLKPFDVKTFLRRSHSLLPKYKRLFQEAQITTGLDWRLLAALSYQESHWDTFSTSPTKVRGLMMLTEATSKRMGVTDRLDPKQSIPGGAKYVNLMIRALPNRISNPDRTYMALASYNIGYAHVEDARVLAQRLGLNPDSWVDVKKSLLKLTKSQYYSKAKYGYCGCAQPIIYVESIRSYYSILTRFETPYLLNDSDPYKMANK